MIRSWLYRWNIQSSQLSTLGLDKPGEFHVLNKYKSRTINFGLTHLQTYLYFLLVAWRACLFRLPSDGSLGFLPWMSPHTAFQLLGGCFPFSGCSRVHLVFASPSWGSLGSPEWILLVRAHLYWSALMLLPLSVIKYWFSTYSMPDFGLEIEDTTEKKIRTSGLTKFSNFHSSCWWRPKICLSSRWVFFLEWFLMWMHRGKK